MSQIVVSGVFAASLFVGVLFCSKAGWKLGRRRLEDEGEDGHSGLGAVEGAVYGLMGLLIAFTFTGAASRFDHRRDLITSEVNAIGTAWLRLDLLDEATGAQARILFRDYIDKELSIHDSVGNLDEVAARYEELNAIQRQIWSLAIAASRGDKSLPIPQLLLPALNEMFDLCQTRFMAALQHPPVAVYVMLGGLVLVSSLLAGFGMAKARRQSVVHLFGFSAIISLSIYLILDLEYPRLGLVRVDSFDQALVDLRASMDEPASPVP